MNLCQKNEDTIYQEFKDGFQAGAGALNHLRNNLLWNYKKNRGKRFFKKLKLIS